jgi:hypothetical protein
MPKRHDWPVSPKGAPGTPDSETPKREWTNLDVDAERAQLEELLDRAVAADDQAEIERISARLRLLDER